MRLVQLLRIVRQDARQRLYGPSALSRAQHDQVSNVASAAAHERALRAPYHNVHCARPGSPGRPFFAGTAKATAGEATPHRPRRRQGSPTIYQRPVSCNRVAENDDPGGGLDLCKLALENRRETTDERERHDAGDEAESRREPGSPFADFRAELQKRPLRTPQHRDILRENRRLPKLRRPLAARQKSRVDVPRLRTQGSR